MYLNIRRTGISTLVNNLRHDTENSRAVDLREVDLSEITQGSDRPKDAEDYEREEEAYWASESPLEAAKSSSNQPEQPDYKEAIYDLANHGWLQLGDVCVLGGGANGSFATPTWDPAGGAAGGFPVAAAAAKDAAKTRGCGSPGMLVPVTLTNADLATLVGNQCFGVDRTQAYATTGHQPRIPSSASLPLSTVTSCPSGFPSPNTHQREWPEPLHHHHQEQQQHVLLDRGSSDEFSLFQFSVLPIRSHSMSAVGPVRPYSTSTGSSGIAAATAAAAADPPQSSDEGEYCLFSHGAGSTSTDLAFTRGGVEVGGFSVPVM